MKDCRLGDYLFYNGTMVKCVGVNEAHRSVILESLDDACCEHCGESLGKRQINVIVSSLNFQNGAEPLQTINNDPTLFIS
jgi:hypothetical protein